MTNYFPISKLTPTFLYGSSNNSIDHKKNRCWLKLVGQNFSDCPGQMTSPSSILSERKFNSESGKGGGFETTDTKKLHPSWNLKIGKIDAVASNRIFHGKTCLATVIGIAPKDFSSVILHIRGGVNSCTHSHQMMHHHEQRESRQKKLWIGKSFILRVLQLSREEQPNNDLTCTDLCCEKTFLIANFISSRLPGHAGQGGK